MYDEAHQVCYKAGACVGYCRGVGWSSVGPIANQGVDGRLTVYETRLRREPAVGLGQASLLHATVHGPLSIGGKAGSGSLMIRQVPRDLGDAAQMVGLRERLGCQEEEELEEGEVRHTARGSLEDRIQLCCIYQLILVVDTIEDQGSNNRSETGKFFWQAPMRSPSFRRPFSKNELGSWSTLMERHRFLLSALVLLVLLCSVYLYFAVTLGASDICSGLTGPEKASCHMQHLKASVAKGKLKHL
ncbi:hypothetical protein HN51_013121 [Arachis hypogaea]